MQIFPARPCTASPRLKLRPLKLYLKGVHEPVHQASKRRNCRQFNDLSTIEMLGKLGEGLIVIASLVPSYQLGPPDYSLLTLTEKRTLKIIV